jgi:hypothetical protein
MKLTDIKVGDTVFRHFGGPLPPMPLKATRITNDRIFCKGGYEFDRETGIEYDEELGWNATLTGSVITITRDAPAAKETVS